MRTIRRSAWVLSAAAALAACPKPPNGPAVAECDLGGKLKSVAAATLTACANAAKPLKDGRHGVGDGQRLAIAGATPGSLTYGPYVTVAPLRGFQGAASVTDLSDAQLSRGVPLTIVEASGAYPKLGIDSGQNVLIVSVQPSDTVDTAVMVSPKGAATYLAVHLQEHADPMDRPLATARWIWSDSDESLWVACGRRCCWVTPLTPLRQ